MHKSNIAIARDTSKINEKQHAAYLVNSSILPDGDKPFYGL